MSQGKIHKYFWATCGVERRGLASLLPLERQLILYQQLGQGLGLLFIHITRGAWQQVQEYFQVILEGLAHQEEFLGRESMLVPSITAFC